MSGARQPRHANSFAFIRFTLASMVIFGHSFNMVDRPDPLTASCKASGTTVAGLAVDGFFVLSGFLITASYLADPSALRYLGKRMRRIYPGFLVASAVTLLVVGPLAADGRYFAAQNWTSLVVGALTLNVPNQVVGVFGGLATPILNGSLWTIRYEFACYLGVLLLGALGLLRRPAVVTCLAVVGTITYLIQSQVWSPNWGGHRMMQLYWVPRFATFFLVGVFFQLHKGWLQVRREWVILAALVGFASLFNPLSYRLLGPWFGGFALLGLGSRASVPGQWFEFLPDVSYGMYLYAFPIQNLLIAYVGDGFGIVFGVAFWLSLLAGTASWYGVERVWVRPRRRAVPLQHDGRLVDSTLTGELPQPQPSSA